MEANDVRELIDKLAVQNDTEATKILTRYYAEARFKIKGEFTYQYCDGANDGGIGFHHLEDSTFFVFQTKYARTPRQQSEAEILHDIQKIKTTLTTYNPNRAAEPFVNAFAREAHNNSAMLEIVWLTTNFVSENVRGAIQDDLINWRKENGWSIGVDSIAIDKNALESVIYDVNHGYTPSTGKRVLSLEKGQWIETDWEQTGVYSIVCTVQAEEILRWFKNAHAIDQFLQKNIRGFEGETKINRGIKNSYLKDPLWFWYKHNGIIMFVDSLRLDKENMELYLRNPQVVNGGQTLKTLYVAYDKSKRAPNPSQLLLRVYRLPYEHTEAYKRSIEIIAALNSQNKILASDLRSTDPRQVRLERLVDEVGAGYRYCRKRSKEIKAAKYAITMRNLALRYLVCKKAVPHSGVGTGAESVFEEPTKYDDVFPENAINKPLSNSHIVVNYLTCWNIDQILQKQAKQSLARIDREYYQYTRWFVLADVYNKTMNWKQINCNNLDWRAWIKFLDSYYFQEAILRYSIPLFKISRAIIPEEEEARSFFKTSEATKEFLSKAHSHNPNAELKKALRRFLKQDS